MVFQFYSISRAVAADTCLKMQEGRIKKMDTHTHRHTHTQNNYCNPRCACTPRVNKYISCLAKAHRSSNFLVINCTFVTVLYNQASVFMQCTSGGSNVQIMNSLQQHLPAVWVMTTWGGDHEVGTLIRCIPSLVGHMGFSGQLLLSLISCMLVLLLYQLLCERSYWSCE